MIYQNAFKLKKFWTNLSFDFNKPLHDGLSFTLENSSKDMSGLWWKVHKQFSCTEIYAPKIEVIELYREIY